MMHPEQNRNPLTGDAAVLRLRPLMKGESLGELLLGFLLVFFCWSTTPVWLITFPTGIVAIISGSIGFIHTRTLEQFTTNTCCCPTPSVYGHFYNLQLAICFMSMFSCLFEFLYLMGIIFAVRSRVVGLGILFVSLFLLALCAGLLVLGVITATHSYRLRKALFLTQNAYPQLPNSRVYPASGVDITQPQPGAGPPTLALQYGEPQLVQGQGGATGVLCAFCHSTAPAGATFCCVCGGHIQQVAATQQAHGDHQEPQVPTTGILASGIPAEGTVAMPANGRPNPADGTYSEGAGTGTFDFAQRTTQEGFQQPPVAQPAPADNQPNGTPLPDNTYT